MGHFGLFLQFFGDATFVTSEAGHSGIQVDVIVYNSALTACGRASEWQRVCSSELSMAHVNLAGSTVVLRAF